MSTRLPGKDLRALPFDLARAVDQACDRFEAAWLAGDRPRIECHLAAVPEEARDVLLAELIAIEVGHRRGAGEVPRLEDYTPRFPEADPAWLDAPAMNTAAPDTVGEGTLPPAPVGEGWPVVPGYEILGVLGEGGMGVVYQARHQALQRLVALKMILPGGRADVQGLLGRFRAEAEAQARLQHPNIVPIYEVGEAGGQPYLALEYLDGGGLDKHLAGTPQPPRTAARLVEVLARAMHAAHQQHIVHRDLKPANVLLQSIPGSEAPTQSSPNDPAPAALDLERWTPKITDFGVAKFLETDRGQTQTGAVMGTPSYMAPEQARGQSKEIGPATDVYALGALLYELLTGRPPFKGPSPLETLEQMVTEEPVSPKRLQPKVPNDLVTICLKCLAKEPRQRYASALALGDDLRRFQAGESIVARPAGTLERAAKWIRRRPGAAGLVGAALLLLVGGLVIGFWYAARERDRANQESILRQQAEDHRVRATQAEQQAQALLAFLQERVLAAARLKTDGGLGKDATILTALQAAEQGITQTFAGQPAVEAAVRDAFGTTYLSVGMPARAVPQLERALALRRQALDADTLANLSKLAQAYREAGRLPEAVALYEQGLEECRARFGPDHPSTLASMNNLAGAYRATGRLAEAIALYEQALNGRRAKLGPDDADTFTSMNNLATAYLDAGRQAEALALFEQVLERRQTRLGPNHPQVQYSMSNLAMAYQAAGRPAQAIALLEQALKGRRAVLGPDHPVTLTTMNNLALAHQNVGQWTEAIALFQEALKGLRARLGTDHPNTLSAMSNLAVAYRAVGRVNDAIALHEMALKGRQARLGREHPDTLLSMNNLARAYQEAGRVGEAVPQFEQALAERRARLGADHPDTLASMNNLAGAYQDAARLAEAVPLYEQALNGRRAKFGSDHPATLQSMNNLAKAYLAANQPDKAFPLFREFLAIQHRRLGRDQSELAAVLTKAGHVLLQHGHHAEAENVLREGLTIREAKLPDHWATFNTKSLLGGSLLGQQKYVEAEPLLVQGYEGMKAREKAIPAENRISLNNALERLVQLYDAWGQQD